MASRLAAGVRPFNMTVTNVPGPQFPLFLLESRMLSSYALVPLWQSHGVGVALFSYDGTVHWGFNADYDIVADVDAFAVAMSESFAELHKAATTAKPAEKKLPKKRPPLGKATPQVAASPKSVKSQKPPASKKATAKKATAKKATAKKATAKKATAKEATAKEAPAKEATAKEATAKKATAKKATAKKATAKKATAATKPKPAPEANAAPKPKK
jgi:flagellar biosynthesis GTPase FlhF